MMRAMRRSVFVVVGLAVTRLDALPASVGTLSSAVDPSSWYGTVGTSDGISGTSWYHSADFSGVTNCVMSKQHAPSFATDSNGQYVYLPVAMQKHIFDAVFQATNSYQICGMCGASPLLGPRHMTCRLASLARVRGRDYFASADGWSLVAPRASGALRLPRSRAAPTMPSPQGKH